MKMREMIANRRMNDDDMPEIVWKREMADWITGNIHEIRVLQEKLMKAIDIYDEPEDFLDASSKIKAKTDAGIAFMEMIQKYMNSRLNEVAEEAPHKNDDDDEDEDEDDEQ